MTHSPRPATQPALITRVNRADGHLRSLIARIGAGKPCLEIARPLDAAGKVVANARCAMIADHIDHCPDNGQSPEDRAALETIARCR